MKDNTGCLEFLVFLGALIFICMIFSGFESKCIRRGCDNDARDGSSYCWLHSSSTGTYKKSNYSSSYNSSSGNSYSSGSSSYNSGSGSSYSSGSSSYNSGSGSSSSYKSNNKTSGSKKSYSSYDDGYEDVYEDDDYDWDRYYSDSDYADGVDDAMDELDW